MNAISDITTTLFSQPPPSTIPCPPILYPWSPLFRAQDQHIWSNTKHRHVQPAPTSWTQHQQEDLTLASHAKHHHVQLNTYVYRMPACMTQPQHVGCTTSILSQTPEHACVWPNASAPDLIPANCRQQESGGKLEPCGLDIIGVSDCSQGGVASLIMYIVSFPVP